MVIALEGMSLHAAALHTHASEVLFQQIGISSKIR